MAERAAALRERLMKVAGADAIQADASAWQVRGVTPALVIAPDSVDAAAAVLGTCSAEGWNVECAGAGSWLHHGRTPARVDVVLTTTRLTGITEYEPADLTIGVRAGTRLEEIGRATAGHGQYVPLDGPAVNRATVGAQLATASAGPLRSAYGAPRDQALGLQLVTGDGRVLRFGGRVVKNVAGYDVVRLLVGSHGTLGLITEAHLRLRALVQADVTLQLSAAEPAPLLEAARAVARVEPAALELVSGATGWVLLTRLRGFREAVDDAMERLRAAVPDLMPLDAEAARTAWGHLARAEVEASVSVRARTRPTTLAATLDAVLPIAGEGATAAGWTACAHVLEGTVRLHAPPGAPWDAARTERFAHAASTARADLAGAGGTLAVPVPPPALPDSFDPHGADAALLPLMEQLRRAFDPEGILAPGRFVVA